MALVDLWNVSPAQLQDKHVSQIIAFAGDGKLGHNKPSLLEFRALLQIVPSAFLERYINECLNDKFDNSGFALQDIVNEIGNRLGFDVVFGRYRGSVGHIGFDGVWHSQVDSRTIVVEVKTTDSYSIDVETIAGYRQALIQAKQAITTKEGFTFSVSLERSSILVVVGREDTGGLEAQIRGSRHAWDMRLISTSALLKLLHLKESLEDPATAQKIRSILTPQEYTKLDGIIDIVFLATEDVKDVDSVADLNVQSLSLKTGATANTIKQLASDSVVSANFNDECVERIQRIIRVPLVKSSRTVYKSQDERVIVACLVSRSHENGDNVYYWFGYRKHIDESLAKVENSYLALGCGSSQAILLIPYTTLSQWLGALNTTESKNQFYWHIRVANSGNNWYLQRKGGLAPLNIGAYFLSAAQVTQKAP